MPLLHLLELILLIILIYKKSIIWNGGAYFCPSAEIPGGSFKQEWRLSKLESVASFCLKENFFMVKLWIFLKMILNAVDAFYVFCNFFLENIFSYLTKNKSYTQQISGSEFLSSRNSYVSSAKCIVVPVIVCLN